MRKVAIAISLLLAGCGGSKSGSSPVDTTLPAGTHAIASEDVDNASDVDLNAAANDAMNDVNSATDNAAMASPDQADGGMGMGDQPQNPNLGPDASAPDPSLAPSNGLN